MNFQSLPEANFVAVDVETAIGKRWSICQIGLAIVEKGEIKQVISELVQPPGNEYSKWNTNVHGITPDMTQKKPTFAEIWDDIYMLLEDRPLVAHNAEFDIDCLKQTLEYFELEVPEFRSICTFRETGSKLDEACAAFEIELTNHHNAGADAEACARLYLKILNGVQPDFTKIPVRASKKSDAFFAGHDQLSGDVLKPDLENADENSPFYNKKVVFTGVMNGITRTEAAELVKKMGADIDTNITKRTDFVITGSKSGPSKMKKILKYNEDGFDIRIVYEEEFLEMVEGVDE